MENLVQDPPLRKYYNYLKSKGADTPDTFDKFEKALSDEGNRVKYFEYLSRNKDKYDVADDYDSFSNALFGSEKPPSKKKEQSVQSTVSPSASEDGNSSAESKISLSDLRATNQLDKLSRGVDADGEEYYGTVKLDTASLSPPTFRGLGRLKREQDEERREKEISAKRVESIESGSLNVTDLDFRASVLSWMVDKGMSLEDSEIDKVTFDYIKNRANQTTHEEALIKSQLEGVDTLGRLMGETQNADRNPELSPIINFMKFGGVSDDQLKTVDLNDFSKWLYDSGLERRFSNQSWIKQEKSFDEEVEWVSILSQYNAAKYNEAKRDADILYARYKVSERKVGELNSLLGEVETEDEYNSLVSEMNKEIELANHLIEKRNSISEDSFQKASQFNEEIIQKFPEYAESEKSKKEQAETYQKAVNKDWSDRTWEERKVIGNTMLGNSWNKVSALPYELIRGSLTLIGSAIDASNSENINPDSPLYDQSETAKLFKDFGDYMVDFTKKNFTSNVYEQLSFSSEVGIYENANGQRLKLRGDGYYYDEDNNVVSPKGDLKHVEDVLEYDPYAIPSLGAEQGAQMWMGFSAGVAGIPLVYGLTSYSDAYNSYLDAFPDAEPWEVAAYATTISATEGAAHLLMPETKLFGPAFKSKAIRALSGMSSKSRLEAAKEGFSVLGGVIGKEFAEELIPMGVTAVSNIVANAHNGEKKLDEGISKVELIDTAVLVTLMSGGPGARQGVMAYNSSRNLPDYNSLLFELAQNPDLAMHTLKELDSKAHIDLVGERKIKAFKNDLHNTIVNLKSMPTGTTKSQYERVAPLLEQKAELREQQKNADDAFKSHFDTLIGAINEEITTEYNKDDSKGKQTYVDKDGYLKTEKSFRLADFNDGVVSEITFNGEVHLLDSDGNLTRKDGSLVPVELADRIKLQGDVTRLNRSKVKPKEAVKEKPSTLSESDLPNEIQERKTAIEKEFGIELNYNEESGAFEQSGIDNLSDDSVGANIQSVQEKAYEDLGKLNSSIEVIAKQKAEETTESPVEEETDWKEVLKKDEDNTNKDTNFEADENTDERSTAETRLDNGRTVGNSSELNLVGRRAGEERIYVTAEASNNGGNESAILSVEEREELESRGVNPDWDKRKFKTNLKEQAQQNDAWLDDSYLDGKTLIHDQKESATTENDVYGNPDGETVTKVNNLAFVQSGEHDQNLSAAIDRIEAHNALFPNVPYTIKGFSNNKHGEVSMVLEQPYVSNAERNGTQEEINEHLEQQGFKLDGTRSWSNGHQVWTNGKYELYDARPANVLKGSDGKLYFIDTVTHSVEYMNKDLLYSGKSSPSSDVTADSDFQAKDQQGNSQSPSPTDNSKSSNANVQSKADKILADEKNKLDELIAKHGEDSPQAKTQQRRIDVLKKAVEREAETSVTLENGRPIVSGKAKGNPAEERKAIREAVKDGLYDSMSETEIEFHEGMSLEEGERKVIDTISEKSINPVEIANKIEELQDKTKDNKETLDGTLAESMWLALTGRGVSLRSFRRHGDRNNLPRSVRSTYRVSAKSDNNNLTHLDIIAEELGVTKNDLIDFMLSYPNKEAYEEAFGIAKDTPEIADLKYRFEQVTGMKATAPNLNVFARKEQNKTVEETAEVEFDESIDEDDFPFQKGGNFKKIVKEKFDALVKQLQKVLPVNVKLFDQKQLSEILGADWSKVKAQINYNKLSSENRLTQPKVPSKNIFLNDVEAVSFSENELSTANKTVGVVSVQDIVPTQKNVNINNLKEVKEVSERPVLFKVGDKYYVVDGHHRLSNEILRGEAEVEADVYDLGVQFLSDNKGTVYGFVKDGQVYIDQEAGMNANTPIHEFGHVWMNVLKDKNKELYDRIIDAIKRDKQSMDEIKNDPAYAHLKTDEQRADEILARKIGNIGEKKYQDKEKQSTLQNVIDVLVNRAWDWIKTRIGKGNDIRNWDKRKWRTATVEDVANAISGELLSGKQMKEAKGEISTHSGVKYSKIDLKHGAKRLIEDLFNAVKINNIKSKPYSIGKLNEIAKEKLSIISNLPFREFTEVVINPAELRHIFNDHYSVNEKDKGNNIPLTDADVGSIGDVINKPNKIAFLGYDKRTQSNKFIFVKESSKGTFVVIEVYGNKGGKLSLKSMYHSKKDIDTLIKDVLKPTLSTSKNDFGVLAQRVVDFNTSDANIPNLIDFDTKDVRDMLDKGSSELSDLQLSMLDISDFDANGNVKSEVAKAIKAEREKIVSEAKANGTFMKAPNGKKSNLNEDQWVTVRTERFKKWFGDWETANKLNLINDSNPVSVERNNLSREQIKEVYQSIENGVNKYDNRKVRFVNSTLGKILNHKGFDSKQIIPQLKEIFDNSVPIVSEAEERREGHKSHPNFKGYHHYLGKINIDGNEMFVRFTVQEVKTRNKDYIPNELHSTFISDVEIYNATDSDLPIPRLLTGRLASTSSATDAKLQHFFESAKEAQENSSKVVDSNGEPMVVYHGSNQSFTEFDTNHGNARFIDRGGIYFSPIKRVGNNFAGGTGNVYGVFLNIKNIKDIEDYFSIATLKKSDAKSLKSDGFDGAHFKPSSEHLESGYMSPYNEEYVAFKSNQIKSATDNVGTFSEESNDIRFQILGEKGAKALDEYDESTHRLDNLGVAREMESAKKTPKEIKIATGWERGVDGKWRYEIVDADVDLSSNKVYYSLDELIPESSELMKAYPELGNIDVTIQISDDANETGRFTPFQDRSSEDLFDIQPEIHVKATTEESAKSILIHEIQHAIQVIEGFAKGGNISAASPLSNAEIVETSKVENAIRKAIKLKESRGSSSLKEIISSDNDLPSNIKKLAIKIAGKEQKEIDVFLRSTPFNQYKMIAGEVEARNVQSRMGMTADERRNSLLEETEDVAREDQNVIISGIGQAMFESSEQKFTPISKKSFDKLINKLKKAFPKFGKNGMLGTTIDELKAILKENNISWESFKGESSSKIQFMRTSKGEVYGAVFPNGKMWIDGNKMNANTPIHEFGHVWINSFKSKNPAIYRRFIEFVKKDPEGKRMMEELKQNPAYAHLSENALVEEVAATLIGNAGENKFNENWSKSVVRQAKDIWDKIKNWLGEKKENSNVREWTEANWQKATLNDWIDNVTNEILSGREINSKFDKNIGNEVSKQSTRGELQKGDESQSRIGRVKDKLGRGIKKAQMELKKPLSKPDWIDLLFNENGALNYENLKKLTDDITSGSKRIQSIYSEERSKTPESSRRAIEATLILEGAKRMGSSDLGRSRDAQSEQAKKQEQLLKEYAEKEGILLNEEDVINNSSEKMPSGREADVYVNIGGRTVTKIVNYKQYSKTPLDFIKERIALFNQLFPDTSYTLKGFIETESGLSFVLEQRMIQGQLLSRIATLKVDLLGQQKRVNDLMKDQLNMESIGLDAVGNDIFTVQDLHLKNVIEGVDGNLYVIDAIPTLADQSLDTGLEIIDNQEDSTMREVQFSIASDESTPNKLTNKVVPLKVAKGMIEIMGVVSDMGYDSKAMFKAGIDHIKTTEWYEGLNAIEKAQIDNPAFRNALSEMVKNVAKAQRQVDKVRNKITAERQSKKDAAQTLTDLINSNDLPKKHITEREMKRLLHYAMEVGTAVNMERAIERFQKQYEKIVAKANQREANSKIDNSKEVLKAVENMMDQGMSFNDIVNSFNDPAERKIAEDQVKIYEEMQKNRIDPAKNKDSFVKKARKKSADFQKRWFANQGGLLKPFVDVMDDAVGKRNLALRKAKQLINDLEREAKKLNFTDWDTVSKALGGDIGALNSLPSEIKAMVTEMRLRIDGLTDMLIQNGAVSADQALILEKNKGEYISRTYDLFYQNKTKRKIMESVFGKRGVGKKEYAEAFNFFAHQALRDMNANPSYSNLSNEKKNELAAKEAEKMISDYLQSLENDFQSEQISQGKDVDSLKEKKAIPGPIRKLLGEHTDPRTQFIMTMARMTDLAYQHEMLQRMKDIGLGDIFYEENDKNRPATHTVKLASDGSTTYSPLNGLYVTPEFKKAFIKSEKQAGELVRIYKKASGAVEWGFTVGSPLTQSINFFANVSFLMLNGLYDVRNLKHSMNTFYDTVFVDGDLRNEYIEILIRKRIVDSSVNLRAVKSDIGDNVERDLIRRAKRGGSKVGRIANRMAKTPNNIYQASDDFFKAYSFFHEANDYAKAFYGKKFTDLKGAEREHIINHAAEVTKNTLANYDRVWEGAALPRKIAGSMVGNFLSFRAESMRTLINSIQYTVKDLKDPETRSVGIRRLSGIMTFLAVQTAKDIMLAKAAGMALSGLSALIAGWGDDDDEVQRRDDFNLLSPPWVRADEKTYIDNGDGTYTIYTVGSLNSYNAVFHTLNAITNGSDFSEKPGLIAAAGEMLDPFLSTNITLNVLMDAYYDVDHYGKPIGDTTEKALYVAKQLAPGAVKLVLKEMDDKPNNNFEMINAVGVKKYILDPTESLGYKYHKYEREYNKLNNDLYRLKNEWVGEPGGEGEFEEKTEFTNSELSKIAKKEEDMRTHLDKFLKVYEAAVRLGADTRKVDEKMENNWNIKYEKNAAGEDLRNKLRGE